MVNNRIVRKACRAALLIGLAIISSGCTTIKVGREFDLQTFATKVQRDATTQTQVRNWLGTPSSTGVEIDTAGNLYNEWNYYYGQGKINDMGNANFKLLQIKFDKDGLVKGYSWSENKGEK